MRICIAYATRHGATLRDEGLEAEVVPVADARVADTCDAIVVGSAAYIGSWLGEASDFVRRNEALLRSRPVWLFTSGPLGTELVDAEGRSVLEDPKGVTELAAAVGARGTKVFFGAFDPAEKPRGMSERLVRMMPASKALLPPGDFRDWAVIDAWAREIAGALREPVATG
jgi:menaquinone-dependent protoporphyrinogen oxidase